MDDITKRISNLSPEKRALLAKRLGRKDLTSTIEEPIAVIGMGCRFPAGANNPEAFGELLEQGFDAVTQTPSERWDADAFFDSDPATPGKANTRWGAYLDQVDKFDAAFFGISPGEARRMDPQQRLLLEIAWEALEDAGQTSERLAGSKTGVFVGIVSLSSEYYSFQAAEPDSLDIYTCTGSLHSVLTNRLSYQFDLRGPSLAVDTACSSSLVAVHLAVRSLRSGESDLALAGGVHLTLSPYLTVMLSKLNMMAGDGRCKTFDSRADGFVRGEGCGLVVLKRLSDAVADQDHILAIIRGTAVNQDGRSNGLTAPNGLAHKALIREALKNGGVDASQITYVETHGTGTALGDPIEVEALSEVIGQPRKSGDSCFLGSVKTNIGHLEGAAGIAGLIKTVLSLQRKRIFPHLHFRELNPYITLKNTPFIIPTKGYPWSSGASSRFAGISAFGVGGTNAHVILEEAAELVTSSNDHAEVKLQEAANDPQTLSPIPSTHLLTLSARSSSALTSLAESYQHFVTENRFEDAASLRDLCFSASVKRSHHDHRLAVVGSSCGELGERLAAFAQGKPDQNYFSGRVPQDRRHALAFVFSGQGPQWAGMGRQLLQEEPLFREVVGRCDAELRNYAEWSLLEEFGAEEAQSRLSETQFAQPAIFALQVGLASLWRRWGVVPDAVIGHSVGEVAAAHIAGALSFEDAIRVIFHRARLMQQATGRGKMASIELPVSEIEHALSAYIGRLSVGAVNSPGTTVVSGEAAALDELLQSLSASGAVYRLLPVNYAFHSPQMDSLKRELIESLEGISPRRSSIPIFSTVSGTLCDGTSMNAEYWWHNLRRPVLFSAAVNQALERDYDLFVEVGPHPVLAPAIAQCLDHRGSEATVVSSLRRRQGERATMLAALAALYTGGYSPDWQKLYPAESRFVKLPAYTWQRKRFWLESSSLAAKNRVPNSSPTVLSVSETFVEQNLRSEAIAEETHMPNTTNAKISRKERLLKILIPLFQELSGLEGDSINPELNFIEMGLDSLFLTQASQAFSKKFAVKISIRQMMEDLDTLDRVAEFLAGNSAIGVMPDVPDSPLPAAQLPPPVQVQMPPVGPSASGKGLSAMERIIQEQLQVMNRQLEALRSVGAVGEEQPMQRATVPNSVHKVAAKLLTNPPSQVPQAQPVVPAHGAFKPFVKGAANRLTSVQEKNLAILVEKYTKRTPESKRLTQRYRQHLADPRSVSGFKELWKEMVYPIVSARSAGSKIWDVDGNEYVDFVMGFGSNLFGHMPPFIEQAIENQLKLGFEIGPQTPWAGKVAELICEFTGSERVAFCNTGSEAVMAALRLARTVTGRDKVVMFNGDYHGMFDEVLVRPSIVGGQIRSSPIAPGIPQSLTENMLVLEYCNPKSLDILRSLLPELAAVIVEPVQSRYLDRQPKEFLQEIRKLTEQSNTALIFDELVTGFRIHPGGAQAVFGIRADLATYGKVLGGGLPIGVVAGKRKFMDALDGGFWQYGDNSSPEVGVTFFAGTFVRHPLALASAHAVLEHLKKNGPDLQRSLNETTTRLVAALNATMAELGAPLHVQHFGSIFYIHIPPELPFGGLLFYFLRDKGIHLWEHRFAVLTTAHTKEDLNLFVRAFRESLREMQAGGFLPQQPAGSVPLQDEAIGDDVRSQRAMAYTVSDFPQAGLNQKQLDELISEIS